MQSNFYVLVEVNPIVAPGMDSRILILNCNERKVKSRLWVPTNIILTIGCENKDALPFKIDALSVFHSIGVINQTSYRIHRVIPQIVLDRIILGIDIQNVL